MKPYDPNEYQGRGPSPTAWGLIDALILSICMGLLYWVLSEAVS